MKYCIVFEERQDNKTWELIESAIRSMNPGMISFEVKEEETDLSEGVTEGEIYDLLTRLGIRPNLKGCLYLRTAIRICLDDKEELDGITKRLYPSIAKRHKTSAGKVEHDIRHMIEASWKMGNEQTQEEIFGYSFRDGRRPTNSEFIIRIVDRLETRHGKAAQLQWV